MSWNALTRVAASWRFADGKIGLGFCFYAVQYTIIFYCNSARVGAATIRLKGGNRSIAQRGIIGRIVAAFTLLFFAMLVPFGAALALAITTKSAALIVAVVAVFVLAVLVTSLIASALSAIYTAAVYRYATEGDPGGMFDAELVRGAFRVN